MNKTIVKNEQPDISIIIPVYNGERYIHRCLDSIIVQGNVSFEIIVVNDGSIDSSIIILEEYQNSYPNIIKIISQKNGGIANARNNGIKEIKGKYLMFMDQDDYIDPDYLFTLFSQIENGHFDVILSGCRMVDSSNAIRRVWRLDDSMDAKEGAKYKIMAPWAKIYRTDLIKNNNVEFFDNNIGEDIVFNIRVYSVTQNIKVIDYIGYNWYLNCDSFSHTAQIGLRLNFISLIEELLGYVINDGKKDIYMEYFIFKRICEYLIKNGRGGDKDIFLKNYIELMNWIKKNLPDYHKNYYLFHILKGADTKAQIVVTMFYIIHRLNLVKPFASAYCRPWALKCIKNH